jgi:hypothetical protein
MASPPACAAWSARWVCKAGCGGQAVDVIILLLLHGQIIPDTSFGAKQGSWGTGGIVRIAIHVLVLIRE